MSLDPQDPLRDPCLQGHPLPAPASAPQLPRSLAWWFPRGGSQGHLSPRSHLQGLSGEDMCQSSRPRPPGPTPSSGPHSSGSGAGALGRQGLDAQPHRPKGGPLVRAPPPRGEVVVAPAQQPRDTSSTWRPQRPRPAPGSGACGGPPGLLGLGPAAHSLGRPVPQVSARGSQGGQLAGAHPPGARPAHSRAHLPQKE